MGYTLTHITTDLHSERRRPWRTSVEMDTQHVTGQDIGEGIHNISYLSWITTNNGKQSY